MKTALLFAILVSALCGFVIGAKDTKYVTTLQNGVSMIVSELPPSRI